MGGGREHSVVTGPEGAKLNMSVDGVETSIGPGVYSGAIVLSID
jgi:hypothetical protein